jgi:hypothetical protein
MQACPPSLALIIDVTTSHGSLAEFHDFVKYKDIASKMMVFFDRQKMRGSYSPNSVIPIFEALGGRTIFFNYPEDIEKCNLWEEVIPPK